MVTTLMEVEALGRRIRADQHKPSLSAEPLGDRCSGFFVVVAAHGQDGADVPGGVERLDGRLLTVDIFGIDKDVGLGLFLADGMDLGNELIELGVLVSGGISQLDESFEMLHYIGDLGHLVTAPADLPLDLGQLLNEVFGLQ